MTGPARAQLSPMNAAGITYGHVHLNAGSAEFATLLDWYIDTFSLTRRTRGKITTTADAGMVNLSFQTSKEPVALTKGRAIDHIGFEVKDLAAFCKKLEAKGIKFDVPYRDVPAIGLKIAFFTDAAGVYIELTEGFANYQRGAVALILNWQQK